MTIFITYTLIFCKKAPDIHENFNLAAIHNNTNIHTLEATSSVISDNTVCNIH